MVGVVYRCSAWFNVYIATLGNDLNFNDRKFLRSSEIVALFCMSAVNATHDTYQCASSSAVVGDHYPCRAAVLKHGILFLGP
jgi:hypothetical protein